METRLISRTSGVAGTEYDGRSIDEIIVGIARVSSSRETNELFDEPHKLLRHCLLNSHWSIFDTCNLTFEIKTSRAVGRELLRHSSIKPQEFSQRYSNVQAFEDIEFRLQAKNNRQSSTDKVGSILYCPIHEDDGFIPYTTEGFSDTGIISESAQAINDVLSCYEDLIKAGVSRETARMILPETAQTTLIFNGTIRSWITLLNVRLHNTAQKECRLVAESIRDVFIKECPIIANSLFNFEDAYDIHILDKIVLEKWGALEAVKANGFKKLVRANQCNQV